MWGYRKSYGRAYSRSPYYKYKKGAVGRAFASGKAAKRADKQENLNVTTQGYFQFNYGTTNPPLSNVVIFNPFMGGLTTTGQPNDAELPTYGGAVNDRAFRLKCSQYDEVRLDSMKVYINPQVSSSSSSTPQMTISTIWDRKTAPTECGVTGNNPNWITGRAPTALEVITNEGALKTAVNLNSTRGAFRAITARNMQEKSYFWDSTIKYNNTQGESPLKTLYMSSWEIKEGGFAPTLYAVSELNMTQVFGQNYVCSYRVEYNFTFRNPKSELSDFIVNENPSYVNPANRSSTMRDTTTFDTVNDFIYRYVQQKRAATAMLRGETLPEVPLETKLIIESTPMEDDTKQEDTEH